FFGYLGLFFMFTSIIIGIPVFYEYLEYQFIYKIPSAILASAIALMAMLSFAIGLILDTQARNNQSLFELFIKRTKNED
ncbi:MAG: hypothetical protein ACI8QQ_002673, partial [Psychroserpens sp.]